MVLWGFVYEGAGSGSGGQLRGWMPQKESVDVALLPDFEPGSARADGYVRNNGYAANAVQLHQDHVVGNFFSTELLLQLAVSWYSGGRVPGICR